MLFVEQKHIKFDKNLDGIENGKSRTEFQGDEPCASELGINMKNCEIRIGN